MPHGHVVIAVALSVAGLADRGPHEPASLSTMTREVLVEAPPERVWRALTTNARLQTWLPARVTVDLRLGGRIDAQPDAAYAESYGGVIVALASGQELSLEIDRTPLGVMHADALLGTKCTVSLTAASAGATIVRLSVQRHRAKGAARFWISVGYEKLMALWRLRSTFEAAPALRFIASTRERSFGGTECVSRRHRPDSAREVPFSCALGEKVPASPILRLPEP